MMGKYPETIDTLHQPQIYFSDTTRVPAPGTPVHLPSYRVPANAKAFIRANPANTGNVFVAPHANPRIGVALALSASTLVFAPGTATPLEIDTGSILSDWFVDAATANDGLDLMVTLNTKERLWP